MSEYEIPDTDLNKISELIYIRYLKDISAFDENYIKKSVEMRLNALCLKDMGEYLALLNGDSGESALLLKSFYNSFSGFFRDGLAFSLIEHSILPSLVSRKSGGELRIWSACCAAGQEAYSLAMLISDYSEMICPALRWVIIATDISEDALEAAKRGVYDESAVSNVRLGHIKKYFKNVGSEYSINPCLRKHIHFAPYDLLDASTAFPPESIYGDFDLVICSNLLIYYRPSARRRIVSKLVNSLSEGAYLISGESEKPLLNFPGLLKPISAADNIFTNSRGRELGDAK